MKKKSLALLLAIALVVVGVSRRYGGLVDG